MTSLLCRCEGIKPGEKADHCLREVVYTVPRSHYSLDNDLLLCGSCGREYKLRGYRVVLLQSQASSIAEHRV